MHKGTHKLDIWYIEKNIWIEERERREKSRKQNMSDSDDDEGWGSADSDKYEPRYVLSFFLERRVKNVSKKNKK